MPSSPALSIITPTLNRRAMIAEALDSIAGIDRTQVEHIVVDGGSTDGTLEFLRGDGTTELIEAPGSGIYEAINIGAAVANGRMIGFLNSDDLYQKDVLRDVLDIIGNGQDIDMVSCRAAVFGVGNEAAAPAIAGTRDDLILTPCALIRGSASINARFFGRAFFNRLGGFDTAFHIASDRDLLIRAMLSSPSHRLLDKVVYLYRSHPGSRTFLADRSTRVQIAREHLEIIDKHLEGSRLPLDWADEFRTAAAIETARISVLDPMRGAEALAGAIRRDGRFPLRIAAATLDAVARRLKGSPRTRNDDALRQPRDGG